MRGACASAVRLLEFFSIEIMCRQNRERGSGQRPHAGENAGYIRAFSSWRRLR